MPRKPVEKMFPVEYVIPRGSGLDPAELAGKVTKMGGKATVLSPTERYIRLNFGRWATGHLKVELVPDQEVRFRNEHPELRILPAAERNIEVPAGIRIEPARLEDLKELVRLEQKNFEEKLRATPEEIERRLRTGFFFKAVDESGRIVGAVFTTSKPLSQARELQESPVAETQARFILPHHYGANVMVDADSRGRGLGRALVTLAVRVAEELKYTRFFALAANPSQRRTLLRNGLFYHPANDLSMETTLHFAPLYVGEQERAIKKRHDNMRSVLGKLTKEIKPISLRTLEKELLWKYESLRELDDEAQTSILGKIIAIELERARRPEKPETQHDSSKEGEIQFEITNMLRKRRHLGMIKRHEWATFEEGIGTDYWHNLIPRELRVLER